MEYQPHRHEQGWTTEQEKTVQHAFKQLRSFFHPDHHKKLQDILGNPVYFDTETNNFLPKGDAPVHIKNFIGRLRDTRRNQNKWDSLRDLIPEEEKRYMSPQYLIFWLEGRLTPDNPNNP